MARQILEDAENDLRQWEPSVQPITTAAGRDSPVHANGASGVNGAGVNGAGVNSAGVNGIDDLSERQSDVLENVSVTEGFTEPVGSGALPAKMVVGPAPA